jgi:hypothetical protein
MIRHRRIRTCTQYEREFVQRYLRQRRRFCGIDPKYLVGGGLCCHVDAGRMSLGTEARMNYPSKLGGNWEWRLKEEDMSEPLAAKLRELNQLYLR